MNKNVKDKVEWAEPSNSGIPVSISIGSLLSQPREALVSELHNHSQHHQAERSPWK